MQGEAAERSNPVDGSVEHHRVAVVGAGIGGMALVIGLRSDGIDDVVLLERDDGVGGTWRSNTYPGAACDVPSHLYCYSFAPNPHWSKAYADQPEILAYLERCADEFGVRPHLRTGWGVASATWSDDDGRWTLEAHDGRRCTADVVVFATGTFGEPRRPEVPGLDTFAGPILHSARWDHDVELAGRRLGVVGTGASGVQIVPAVVDAAAHTTVFQRTPAYVLPRKDPAFPPEEQARLAGDPAALAELRRSLHDAFESATVFRLGDPLADVIAGVAREHLERKVADPELRAVLTPDYPLGCNRTLISSAWYRTLVRDDVTLVASPVTAVEPGAVRTADGGRHDVDVLVLATGFHAGDYLHGIEVRGRDGTSLRDTWADGPSAYLGMTVPGFPNCFVFYGPNTNQGGNSIILILEAQAAYVRSALARTAPGAVLEVRQDAFDRYEADLQAALADTVWSTGCRSYFTSPSGRVVTQLPHPAGWYVERTATFDLEAYHHRPG